ncbi:MAG: NYN domain-containing protein [Candidatus Binatia bacterium]
MDVIIDGYNLIGSEQGLRGALEHKRSALVQQLARYQKVKGFVISVVFDGWKAGRCNESSERVDGVMVTYSRQGEKADGVVVRLARERGSGCVVVSSDREVRNSVEKFGATAIYAGEFNEILRQLDAPGTYDENYEAGSATQRGGNRLAKTERRRREKLQKLRLE